MTDPLTQYDPQSLLNKIVELESRLAAIEQGFISVGTLEEVANDTDLYSSRFISPKVDSASSDPASVDFSGSFVAGSEQVMADETQDAWLAKINAGIVEFSVGVEGIYQNRLTNGYRHIANDGTTYRRGLLGMTTLPGQTAPSFGITYADNSAETELLTNGSFETGDFTGWTAVSGATWSIQTSVFGISAYDGEYFAYSASTEGSEKKQIISVTAGDFLRIQCALRAGKIVIDFFTSADGSGAAFEQYSIVNSDTSSFTFLEKYTEVPSGANSAAFRIIRTTTGSFFDALSLIQISVSNYFGFEPRNGKLISNMLDGNSLVGQIPVGDKNVLRVEEVKDKLTATVGAAGNVNVGTHYAIVTFVDPYGETDADLSQSTSIVVSTSAKTVALSAIPLGRWDTTARRVYVTAAGATQTDSTAYKLLAEIADNTTTTATYNVADANLSATTIPTVNTTGSRPIFPRAAEVFADAMIYPTVSPASNDVINFDALQMYGYTRYINAAATAIGQIYFASVYLEAGSYTLYVLGATNAPCGISSVYLDGVLQNTIDWYSAGVVRNVTKSISVTVPTSGYHLVEFAMLSRHASATAYQLPLTKIRFLPSAF
jgi:hypothetical protein